MPSGLSLLFRCDKRHRIRYSFHVLNWMMVALYAHIANSLKRWKCNLSKEKIVSAAEIYKCDGTSKWLCRWEYRTFKLNFVVSKQRRGWGKRGVDPNALLEFRIRCHLSRKTEIKIKWIIGWIFDDFSAVALTDAEIEINSSDSDIVAHPEEIQNDITIHRRGISICIRKLTIVCFSSLLRPSAMRLLWCAS